MATLHKLVLMCGLALSAGAMVGCTSSDGDWGRDRDYDRARTSSDRYDPDYRDRGDVEVDRHTSDRIPRDARMVEQGRGALDHTARRDGTVYVYDVDARTVIFDTKVRDGDRIVLNPDRNRIALNGRDLTNIDIKSRHEFRIYFEPAGYRHYRD